MDNVAQAEVSVVDQEGAVIKCDVREGAVIKCDVREGVVSGHGEIALPSIGRYAGYLRTGAPHGPGTW